MSKKPKYCIGAVSEGSLIECPPCGEKFQMMGLKPVNKKKIDKEIERFKKAGRIKECFCCDHKVIVCENCSSEDVVVCDCCVEEAENLGMRI